MAFQPAGRYLQSRHFRLGAKARSLAEFLNTVGRRRNPAE
jgi:hypothetical protein